MIFIVVKFTVRPDRAEQWLSLVDDFTRATRAEPGNLFFDWSRSVEDPNVFVLTEGFASQEAGVEHVQSEHFKTATELMSEAVATTPDIINVDVPGDGWSKMGEVTPKGA
ncbi:putative quinol monooxygenase [Saccharopolyspora sp. NFXS83]|uniref:putative quinol monooxygenase n=1 Tax=Saccharopolyspora sp. NFXS83 TaxID=2993560 RepID=UPI00224B03D7|nr:putative quinol monooxygenase [Saccharopolyspora sp. NFXS83]MCX2729841.1 putative quinol monooxygenase [Saccharopolyspora sp. NFXS83]